MEGLNMIEPPAFPFLSLENGNDNPPSSSILTPLRSLANRKSYGRGYNPRRSKLNKTSRNRSLNRRRRQKWQSIYSGSSRRDPSAGNSVNGRQVYNAISGIEGSSIRPDLPVSSVSLQPSSAPSTPSRKSRRRRNVSLDENDVNIGNDSQTPSPIRNSPSYGRRTNRRDNSSLRKSHTTSSTHSKPSSENSADVHFENCYPEEVDESEIDTKLIDKLRRGPQAKNRDLGRVYTFKIEEDNRFVKIGWTKRDSTSARESAVSPGRRYGTVRNVPDTTPDAQRRFYNSFHAEQIVLLELRNYRRKLMEGDKLVETEWFEININEAILIVRKWRQWLIKWKPYDRNGQLTAFWETRLNEAESYNVTKHKSLHERWNTILHPTWWDRTRYTSNAGWRTISMCWKEYRLLSSAFIVIFFHYLLSTMWALVLILGVLVVNWPDPAKPTSGARRQRK